VSIKGNLQLPRDLNARWQAVSSHYEFIRQHHLDILGDGERVLISELVEGLRKRGVEAFGENIDYSVLHKIYGREMPDAPVPL